MNKSSRVYVAGHRGLVGSAVIRKLKSCGYKRIITHTSKELDLRRQEAVERFFREEKPEYVFLAAARVGGILANVTYQADFIYDNIIIAANVIKAAADSGVEKLVNLGSSCIYPRLAPQPLKEEYLLAGPLEPTNEPYAVAKIAAIKLCRYFNAQYGTNFISVMPTNLYGPNDNFDLETSHVLPALIRRFHEAKEQNLPAVTLWGDGSPEREFLYVDDLADALVFFMERYEAKALGEFVNIGTGKDISIRDLAAMIRGIVGYKGEIRWDASKPSGTPRKLLDVGKINQLGWKADTSLKEGIELTYSWFQENRK